MATNTTSNGSGGDDQPGFVPSFEDFYRQALGRGGSARMTLRRFSEIAEAWCITAALREHRGNRSAAARSLGIGRRTLYSKMERLDIQPSWSMAGERDAET